MGTLRWLTVFLGRTAKTALPNIGYIVFAFFLLGGLAVGWFGDNSRVFVVGLALGWLAWVANIIADIVRRQREANRLEAQIASIKAELVELDARREHLETLLRIFSYAQEAENGESSENGENGAGKGV